jgi:hypothetical protein
MLDGHERVGDGRGGCGMSGEGLGEDLRFVKTLAEGAERLVGIVFGLRDNFWEEQRQSFHFIPCWVHLRLIFTCCLQACGRAPVLHEVLGSSRANANLLVAPITLVTAIVIDFGVWRW